MQGYLAMGFSNILYETFYDGAIVVGRYAQRCMGTRLHLAILRYDQSGGSESSLIRRVNE